MKEINELESVLKGNPKIESIKELQNSLSALCNSLKTEAGNIKIDNPNWTSSFNQIQIAASRTAKLMAIFNDCMFPLNDKSNQKIDENFEKSKSKFLEEAKEYKDTLSKLSIKQNIFVAGMTLVGLALGIVLSIPFYLGAKYAIEKRGLFASEKQKTANKLYGLMKENISTVQKDINRLSILEKDIAALEKKVSQEGIKDESQKIAQSINRINSKNQSEKKDAANPTKSTNENQLETLKKERDEIKARLNIEAPSPKK